MSLEDKPKSGKPDLVLVTSSYPYGYGEQFLALELEYLREAFDRITVVPARIHGEPRPLPPGVEVETTLGQSDPAQAGLNFWGLVRLVLYFPILAELLRHPLLFISPERFKRMTLYAFRALIGEYWFNWLLDRRELDLDRTVFYTYWLGPLTWALTRVERKHPGMILASRVHGGEIYREQSDPPYLPFTEETLIGPEAIFNVSQHGRRFILDRYPGLLDRVEVSLLGVRDPGRPARGSDDGVLRILTNAFLYPLKRLHLLVEGLEVLLGWQPDLRVEWTHIGDGPLRGELEEKARDFLEPRVKLKVLGVIPNEEVYRHYQENPVDVLVNLSVSEGMPVSIMEALAFGVPVVATAAGGVPEVIGRENGWLLPLHPTPDQIAEGLAETFLISPQNKIRQAARATYENNFQARINYPAFAQRLAGLAEI